MPKLRSHRLEAGFTYLELVIVIAIIASLLYFALDRLLKLQVVAERAAVQQIIGQLQSAIGLTIGEHIVEHDIPGLKKYVSTNPMLLFSETPVNYLGSFASRPEPIAGASWWYDQTNGYLVYQVANKQYFQSDGPEKSVIKLKILPVYDDINHNRRFDRRDVLKGLRLVPTHPYRWSNEPIDVADYTAKPNNTN